MLKAVGKVLTFVSLILVFFLFVFSMPDSSSPVGMVSFDGSAKADVCSVFYTGHGSFYCEFGDTVCEKELHDFCFGK
ncbi:hypothetical protein DRJ22_05450 [Candidatus Woesearchaeota archaeon]|nr:MAG: hypothetical protein DRJ22_05450 [Candidatus Woesearchaeota archaeon]